MPISAADRRHGLRRRVTSPAPSRGSGSSVRIARPRSPPPRGRALTSRASRSKTVRGGRSERAIAGPGARGGGRRTRFIHVAGPDQGAHPRGIPRGQRAGHRAPPRRRGPPFGARCACSSSCRARLGGRARRSGGRPVIRSPTRPGRSPGTGQSRSARASRPSAGVLEGALDRGLRPGVDLRARATAGLFAYFRMAAPGIGSRCPPCRTPASSSSAPTGPPLADRPRR